MQQFMDEDFILNSETARKLYHTYAERLPIIDYHCHISPKEIRDDVHFNNITELWLGGDHYKWRLMRANGVPEEYITGNADPHDKFIMFARALERAIGNPVHQWSHLELKRYFGYNGPLNGDTAEEVWKLCNEKLATPEYSARGIMKMSNVSLICTTDDPIDTLEYHDEIAADETFDIRVLPAFRPDRAVDIEKPDFTDYIAALGEAAGIRIEGAADVKAALKARMEFFTEHGCVLADHGLGYVPYAPASDEQVDAILRKALAGMALTDIETEQYKTSMLIFCAGEYKRRGWVNQLHFGVKRENNRTAFAALGANAGLDCILSGNSSTKLAELLNRMTELDGLGKTVLYSLDPNDNAIIDTVMACFQDASCVGKLQHGAAWWFNDHKAGMEAQMKTLAAGGLLGNFIGMLTDSRSFVSYTRHEYFRRIMCNVIAEYVENGEYPNDEKCLGRLVADISFNNIKRYLGL